MVKFKSILLIDDDEISNFLCEETIKSSGITEDIIPFSGADDALEYLKQNNQAFFPEVIFLDINMPGTSGWEFLEDLHTILEKVNKQVKVFILSSSNFNIDIQKSKKYIEVADYISKPLTSAALELILKKHTQGQLSQSTCS